MTIAKAHKRTVSKVLALIILLGMVYIPNAGTAVNDSDPFSYMYDSGALFKERVSHLLEEHLMRMKMEEACDRGLESGRHLPVALGAGEVRISEQELELAIGSVLKKAKLGELSTAGEIDFTDLKTIEQIYEDTRVDRFIVTYRNSGSSISGIRGINVQSTHIINRANDLGGGVDYEIIQLAERVNPAELAGQLRAAGMESKLRYIMPDFIMEYAGSGLSGGR